MTSDLTAFERDVIGAILARATVGQEVLWEQLRLARVADREMTGAGFYTNLSIPAEAPRLGTEVNLELDEVEAEIDGLEHGAGFLLFVRNGALDFLEGYSYEEPWPETLRSFRLKPVRAAEG